MDATFGGFQLWQWAILAVTIIACTNYIYAVATDRLTPKEGFTGGSAGTAAGPDAAEESRYEWLDNTAIYDTFTSEIYDKLVQGEKRSMLEAMLLRGEWERATPTMPPAQWRVLDAGCGTGILTAAFAKMGVQRVVGLDRSEAMISRARETTLPATTLSPQQRASVEFRVADLESLAAAGQAEFTHAAVMYFVIYYIKDKPSFFRNMAYWIAPGGVLSVHVVNKYKFDPMLEAAAPTVFSLQKYASERIMKSQVVFDRFDYEGVFDIDDAPGARAAEFRETFRFKDGSVRRQRHVFDMPDIQDIVAAATAAGWQYRGYADNVAAAFEYSYTLLFVH